MVNPKAGFGRRTEEGRFMEAPTLLRTVAAPGDANTAAATIEALVPYIDASLRVEYPASGYRPRLWARDNLLHLQIVADATVSAFDVEIFATMLGTEMETADLRWSYIYKQTGFTRSQIITLEQIPPGHVKVLIPGVVGSGNVRVYYAISD